MSASTIPLLRKNLRRELRARRSLLSGIEQQQAAENLVGNLLQLSDLMSAKHIAMYWPADGEIDPRGLMRSANLSACNFYLPVLQDEAAKPMRFVLWREGEPLLENRFGIPEPVSAVECEAEKLDIVILPLTGFDAAKNRLGMGGGFYDRTFAFRKKSAKPLLIGVAHACQQLENVPVEAWDVPLDFVVTDSGIL